jgi:Lrp/AsnC family transcriptional regulator, leucine-responsive regulatory protein
MVILVAKINEEPLPKDELQVLTILEEHAKETVDEIARQCGFSRQKVSRIIKDLEQKKIIWGYSAVIDNKKENREKFILFIKRTQISHDPKDIDEIIDNLLARIKKDLEVTMISSYRIHGEYDWVMIFTAHDIVHAKKFSQSIMDKFSGKQTIHISQVLFTVRENYIRNPNTTEMKDFI